MRRAIPRFLLLVLGLVLGATLVVARAARAADPAGDAQAGKAVYEANCLACHGPSGKGDGPAAAALNPKPMDFTDRARMTKVSLATRTAVVTSGGAANGLSAAMPPFQDVLTAQQIRDVLAYVNQNFCH